MKTFKRIVFTIFAAPCILVGGIIVGIVDFFVSIIETYIEVYHYVWTDQDEWSDNNESSRTEDK